MNQAERTKWTSFLDNLGKMGYKDFTVAEMVNNIAGMPPLMSIFIYDEDTDEKKFLNNIEVSDEEIPIVFISVGKLPKNPIDRMTHNEKVAHKKELAEQMERESR
jgi:hypothetical protein